MADTSLITGPRPLVATARVILWALITIATLVAVGSIVAGVAGVMNTLATGLTHLTLVANKGSVLFNLHHATVSTHIVSGRFSTAAVTVTHLPAGIVALTIVAAVASILTEVALCILIALLAWRLLRGRLFRRSMSVIVIAAGFILTVGGLLSQGAHAVAGGAAAAQLNGGGRGYWPLAGTFDPTLPVVGIVLLLVGFAFEYGTRLQRDTEGLI